MSNRGTPTVRHALWREGARETPMVLIYSGSVFVRIPYSEARRIVDEVHDLCDAYEGQQRPQS